MVRRRGVKVQKEMELMSMILRFCAFQTRFGESSNVRVELDESRC